MKCPKITLMDIEGKIIGERLVRTATWGVGGKLEVIHVENDGILPMYDLMERGTFESLDGRIIGKLMGDESFCA